MKNLKVYVLALLVAGSVFSSCKKDEDKAATKSKTDLLTAKTWKISGATLSGADAFSLVDACMKDDTQKFNTDKSLVQNNGTNKCDNTEPATYTGSWTFINGEAGLRMIIAGDTTDGTISTLDATTLKLSNNDNGVNATITYTAQ